MTETENKIEAICNLKGALQMLSQPVQYSSDASEPTIHDLSGRVAILRGDAIAAKKMIEQALKEIELLN